MRKKPARSCSSISRSSSTSCASAFARCDGRAVAIAQAFAADALEFAERRGALGQRGRGQPVAEVAGEVEAAAPRDAHRVRRRLGVVAREALGLLLGTAQPELGVGTALGVRFVEGRAVADRDQHVLQPVPLARVVVHVAGADDAHAGPLGEPHERLVARAVAVDVVVLQLDEDLLRPEPADEAPQRVRRLGPAPGLHEGRDAPLAAAGEHDQPGRVAFERGERHHGVDAARLLRAAVGLAQAEGEAGEAAKVGVALARLGQQREVRAHLAVLAPLANDADVVVFGRGLGDGQFEAGDGAQPLGAGGAGELHRPEHAVVVGERERRVALLDGGAHELIGARGTVEQRVVAVQVQLDVGDAVEHVGAEGPDGVARRARARRVLLGARLPGLELVPALHVAGLLVAAPTCHGVTPSPRCDGIRTCVLLPSAV